MVLFNTSKFQEPKHKYLIVSKIHGTSNIASILRNFSPIQECWFPENITLDWLVDSGCGQTDYAFNVIMASGMHMELESESTPKMGGSVRVLGRAL